MGEHGTMWTKVKEGLSKSSVMEDIVKFGVNIPNGEHFSGLFLGLFQVGQSLMGFALHNLALIW